MEMESMSQILKVIPEFKVGQSSPQQSSEVNFGNMLKNAINDVNSMQLNAGKYVDQMVSGDAANIHDVMIAVEKARTSFDLLMEVRNKTLDMYRELMRMQV